MFFRTARAKNSGIKQKKHPNLFQFATSKTISSSLKRRIFLHRSSKPGSKQSSMNSSYVKTTPGRSFDRVSTKAGQLISGVEWTLVSS